MSINCCHKWRTEVFGVLFLSKGRVEIYFSMSVYMLRRESWTKWQNCWFTVQSVFLPSTMVTDCVYHLQVVEMSFLQRVLSLAFRKRTNKISVKGAATVSLHWREPDKIVWTMVKDTSHLPARWGISGICYTSSVVVMSLYWLGYVLVSSHIKKNLRNWPGG